MTHETVVHEMFRRFPDLKSVYRSKFDFMGDEEPLTYLAFEGVLVPHLEKLLAKDNDGGIAVCAYLEGVAVSASKDGRLKDLLRIAIGEWLPGAADAKKLSTWLGAETKRLLRI